MNNQQLYSFIHEVLKEWNPIGVPEYITDAEYENYIPSPDGHSRKERMFKAQISECTLKDTDGTDIIISLNIDQDDYLFELDIWKCDFTPVISKIEDWIF